MSWRKLITGIHDRRHQQPGIAGKPEFYPGASAATVADAEAVLNAALPGLSSDGSGRGSFRE